MTTTTRNPVETALNLGGGTIFKPIKADGREASYYELDDGTKLPRVSSITKVVANPYLEDWKMGIIREKMIEEFPEGAFMGYIRGEVEVDDILDSANRVASEAAALGTTLHKFIDGYMGGGEEIAATPDIEPAAEAYVKWLEAHPELQFCESESAVYVDERGGKDAWGNSLPVFGDAALWYAGTIDALFWDHSNQCWHIVDWKTTKNGRAYPDNAMQIAAYCYALHSMIRMEDNEIYGGDVTTHDGSLEGELANRHKLPYGLASVVVFDNDGGMGKAKKFKAETLTYRVDPQEWLPRFRSAHYLDQQKNPSLTSVRVK